MQHNIGLQALRKILESGDVVKYYSYKLSSSLFKGEEVGVFNFIDNHMKAYNCLPSLSLVSDTHPIMMEVACPDKADFYLDMLVKRYGFDLAKTAVLEAQEKLKNDQFSADSVFNLLQKAGYDYLSQKMRRQIMEFSSEGKDVLLQAYNATLQNLDSALKFGWPYMDAMSNGILPGDLVSIVGRPAAGKTWMVLWMALFNWRYRKKNVLFVSMEMNRLAIVQRAGSVYANLPLKQLKKATFSSVSLKKFIERVSALKTEEANLYVVDGNLAVNVNEIYLLADMLECDLVVIDGAYLVRSSNSKLDRYSRVAENVELMKTLCGEKHSTVASWQFNRSLSKDEGKKNTKTKGLENIGYSDAIGQISSVALGLMQEESVETVHKREVDVMKGRNGEVGRFEINWDFMQMNFSQLEEKEEVDGLKFI